MYDEYAAAARKWLPCASVFVDRFHVVKQLTEAVNKLRVAAMARHADDALSYNFMKSKWKTFLRRKRDIPDKWYTRKLDGESWHYDELIGHWLGLDADLSNAYDCLQDLYYYMRGQPTLAKAPVVIDKGNSFFTNLGNLISTSFGYPSLNRSSFPFILYEGPTIWNTLQ